MESTLAESWWRKSFRALAVYPLRTLPIPGQQKWVIAGFVADRLKSPSSPPKVAHMASEIKMLLDLSKVYERRSYYSGIYNSHLTRIFKQLLKPGDTVIDGGANIGYMSLLAAQYVGEHGNVHAFEPIPQTFEILNKNICLNSASNIYPNRQALAERVGELCFSVPIDANTGKVLDRLATLSFLRQGSEVSVPACTLDEYATSSGITKIKLVKLDLEGGEVSAIEGMRKMLSAHKISYLICELNLALLDKLNISYSAIREALHEYGYKCYYINHFIGFARIEHVDLVDTSFIDKSCLLYGDYLFAAPGMPVPRKG